MLLEASTAQPLISVSADSGFAASGHPAILYSLGVDVADNSGFSGRIWNMSPFFGRCRRCTKNPNRGSRA